MPVEEARVAAELSAEPEMRLTGRVALGAGLAAAAAAPLLILLLLVEWRYEALENLDRNVADMLHRWALAHAAGVDVLLFLQSALAPNTFRAAAGLAAIALWRYGRHRLARWAVVTTAAGALLAVVLKPLVHRARPSFPDPVATAGSYSFPSGHALGSFLGAGVLLVIVLPLLSRTARTLAWTAAVVLVLLTGFDRLALGVHYVSDVLGGWIAAGALLLGTTTAFGTWRPTFRRPVTGRWTTRRPTTRG